MSLVHGRGEEWSTRPNKECNLGAVMAAGAAPVVNAGPLFYTKPSKVSRKAGRSGAPMY
jgi:hypothetical protein